MIYHNQYSSFKADLMTVVALWARAIFFMSISIYAISQTSAQHTLGDNVIIYAIPSGILLLSIWSYYMASLHTLWMVRFSPEGMEWRKFFKTHFIPRSSVADFEFAVRTGNRGRQWGYFIVRRASGERWESAPLPPEYASELTETAKSWLSAT